MLNYWFQQRGYLDGARARATFAGGLVKPDTHIEAGRRCGYSDSAATVEAGETPPAGLEDILRRNAAIWYFGVAQDGLGLLTGEKQAEFRALRDQINPGPSARWAELLPAFQDLAFGLRRRQGPPPERTDPDDTADASRANAKPLE